MPEPAVRSQGTDGTTAEIVAADWSARVRRFVLDGLFDGSVDDEGQANVEQSARCRFDQQRAVVRNVHA